MRMEDDVDAPYGGDLDSDVDMEWDGDNVEKENEEEEDEGEEAEEEEDEVEEDEEEEEDDDEDDGKEPHEDDDEDDGKEPHTIGQGEMVNTLIVNVNTMLDDQSIILPEQCQEMHEHTPRPLTSSAYPKVIHPGPSPPMKPSGDS